MRDLESVAYNVSRCSNWRWPDIPGLHSFQGPLVHSAAWDSSVSYKGKRVAVLGCGSSGVQIVPTIQPGEWSEVYLGSLYLGLSY